MATPSVPPAPAPGTALRGVAGDAWPAALAVLAVYGLLEWLRPGYFLWDDNASFYLPAAVHNYRAVVGAGVLPHLNLHQYLGQIWLGNGQSAVLYPPLYLAAGLARLVWGDLRPTVDLLAVMHLAAAAAGMLALVRHLGAGRAASALAALGWATAPFVAQVARNWVFVAYLAALLPWNLLCLERLLRAPSVRRVLALALVKALLFYQGYVQYAVMAALFDGLWIAAGWWLRPPLRAHWRRAAAGYLGALLATGALAAPLLLPMLEVKRLSAYRARALSFEEFLSNAMPPGTFLRAQVGVMDAGAIHGASGAIFYLGLPALAVLAVLAGRALRRRRRGLDRGLGTATAAACLAVVALVAATPAWGALYRVPLLSSFRWPFKSFLFAVFFATLAVALGCDRWAAGAGRRRRWLALAVLLAGPLAHLAILFAPRFDRPFGPYRLEVGVAALRAEVAGTLPLGEGRVISLWQRHRQASMARHLTLDFATLVGAYHLGGYDPLIATENLELALGLEYSNIFRYALDARVLAHLSAWGVRWLVTPTGAREAEQMAPWPQLVAHHRDPAVTVYENTAALPLASFHAAPRTPVPFEWQVNGVTVHPGGRAGTLRLALAPLPWWTWSIDGADQGPVPFDASRQMALPLPAGARTVTVVYRNAPFRIGVGIMLVASLLAAGVVVRGGVGGRYRERYAVPGE